MEVAPLTTIDKYCELTKTSLIFKRKVSKDEWFTVFNSLKTVEGCVQFWIGDCLAHRQQEWGMYDDVIEGTGLSKQTIKHLKSISEKVPSTARLPDLSFTHHAEVAALPEEKQREFLQKASEEQLSVRELREQIHIAKPIKTYDKLQSADFDSEVKEILERINALPLIYRIKIKQGIKRGK